MKTKLTMILALAALLVLATATAAGEAKKVKLEGKITCAKCSLGMKDATDCQTVLVVESEKDVDPSYYYLVDNDVTEAFGHACTGAKPVMVTGAVEKKGDKMWLTATKMKEPKSKKT